MNEEFAGRLNRTSSAAQAPPEVLKWAEKILTAQGCPGRLSQEKSGYHLYIPCPECLATLKASDRKGEMNDPKYSINLSKLAGVGEERIEKGKGMIFDPAYLHNRMALEERNERRAGVCMRTWQSRRPHIIPLSEILAMGTVTERHPDIRTSKKIVGSAGTSDRESHWEKDEESGELCPPPPGEVVSLVDLPPDHPAVCYLTQRGYAIGDLVSQFQASFCFEEYPHKRNGVFYRRMPGAWRDTPQHRVILKAVTDGKPVTWQARLIERVSPDGLNNFMLHPYSGGFYPTNGTMGLSDAMSAYKRSRPCGEAQAAYDAKRGGYWIHTWSWVASRANPQSSWIPVTPYDEVNEQGTLKFKPAKYRTAKYSSRQPMGWDAAIKRSAEDPDGMRWAVLVEGPLDAARVGPGGLAILGKSLSGEVAELLARNFMIIFMGLDTDVHGKRASQQIREMLNSKSIRNSIIQHVIDMPIPDGKDLGDMTQVEYNSMFKKLRRRMRRYI